MGMKNGGNCMFHVVILETLWAETALAEFVKKKVKSLHRFICIVYLETLLAETAVAEFVKKRSNPYIVSFA